MRSQTSVGTIRDALCVGGEERRRVVEAHEEAEEAHGFGRQSEEGSIIVTHDRTDPFEPPPLHATVSYGRDIEMLRRADCQFGWLRGPGNLLRHNNFWLQRRDLYPRHSGYKGGANTLDE
jgi:hypothetical protein